MTHKGKQHSQPEAPLPEGGTQHVVLPCWGHGLHSWLSLQELSSPVITPSKYSPHPVPGGCGGYQIPTPSPLFGTTLKGQHSFPMGSADASAGTVSWFNFPSCPVPFPHSRTDAAPSPSPATKHKTLLHSVSHQPT